MPKMTTIIALLIILGGLSGVSAWIIGPTRGLLVSAQDGSLPRYFSRTNKFGAPVMLLITQALIVTVLSTIFILFDSINAAYWLLSDLCAQMALMVYVIMFAAAIKLRYTHPNQPRSYKIPGGNKVMWFISGIGILCCLTAMFIGFIPPSQIPIDDVFLFELFLISGLILFVVIPWLFTKRLLST